MLASAWHQSAHMHRMGMRMHRHGRASQSESQRTARYAARGGSEPWAPSGHLNLLGCCTLRCELEQVAWSARERCGEAREAPVAAELTEERRNVRHWAVCTAVAPPRVCDSRGGWELCSLRACTHLDLPALASRASAAWACARFSSSRSALEPSLCNGRPEVLAIATRAACASSAPSAF